MVYLRHLPLLFKSLAIFFLLLNPAHATIQVVKYGSGTPVYVCQANDATSGCGSGGGGSGNVGIGTTQHFAGYVGVSTLGPFQTVEVAGNVGIGSLSPGTALDVNGDSRSKDGFYVRNYGIGTHSIATTGMSAANTAGDSILINAARGFGTGTGGNSILLGGDGGQTGVGGIARLQAGNGGNATGATQNTIALVSSTQKVSTNLNNVTTAAIDTTGATLLVVSGTSFPLGTLTDSKSNSWTKLTTYSNGVGSVDTAIYYAANPIVGSGHTFTFTQSSGAPSISVLALSGAKTTSPADGDNGNAAFNSLTSVSTGSITPAEDNEVIVTTIGGGPSAGTWSADSGTTNIGYLPTVGGQGYGTGIAYKIQTTAASINPTWSGPSGSGSVAIASFKVAPLSSSGNGGNVKILSGYSGTDSGNAGNITIDSGNKNTGSAGNLLLMTNGQGGNVGIGTLTPGTALDITGRMRQSIAPDLCPAGNYPLGIDGSLNVVSCTAAGGASSNYWNLTAAAGNVGVSTFNTVGIGTTKGSAALTVMNGNVGIGTWNPQQILDVKGTAQMTGFSLPTGAGANLVLLSNTVGIGTWSTIPAGGGGGSGTVNSGVSTFYGRYPATGTTIDDSAITMDDGTNVGIGTITPSAKLTISTSAVQDLLRINDDGITDTTPLVVDQIGNVGIGSANPSAVLAISSTAAQMLFRIDDNGTGDLSPLAVDEGGNVGIGTTNTQADKLLIMGGNVGIGTWIPSTALDVKGTIIQSNNPGNCSAGSYPLGVDGSFAAETCTVAANTAATYITQTADSTLSAEQALSGLSTGIMRVATTTGVITSVTDSAGIAANVSDETGTSALVFSNNPVLNNVGIGTTLNTAASLVVMQGNVGIGTWIPAQTADVKGSLSVRAASGSNVTTLDGNNVTCFSASCAFSNSSNNSGATSVIVGSAATNGFLTLRSTSGVGASDYIDFSTGNAGATHGFRVITDGNVGIGTVTPLLRLQINTPTTTPFSVSSGGNVGIGTTVNQTALSVMNGNVGIGTWAPTSLLVVAGTGNTGIGTTVVPTSPLTVGGNILLDRTTSAIIMKETDGTCGSCVLSSTEALTCSSIACP